MIHYLYFNNTLRSWFFEAPLIQHIKDINQTRPATRPRVHWANKPEVYNNHPSAFMDWAKSKFKAYGYNAHVSITPTEDGGYTVTITGPSAGPAARLYTCERIGYGVVLSTTERIPGGYIVRLPKPTPHPYPY